MSRTRASAGSDQPLSPELVLVDPELARRAREQLSVASLDSERAVTTVAPTRARRSWRRVLSWAFVGSAVVAGIALAVSASTRSEHRVVAQQIRAAPAKLAAKRFVWPPNARARYYDVAFFRGRTKIFERRVVQPALTLPAHWTFRRRRYALTRGLYEWRVRPGFGRSLGRAIVRSSLAVP
jgi:hypothetical protein